MEKNTMKIVKVEPGEEAVIVEIEKDLDAMQELVHGNIECIYFDYEDPVVIVCNEEGKIRGMQLNRALLDDNGNILDIIAGTFFIAGIGTDDFIGLGDELAEKYRKMYERPEAFVRTGEGIIRRVIRPQNLVHRFIPYEMECNI